MQQSMVFGSFEQVEDQDVFDPIPAGRYQLRITRLEFKTLTHNAGARYAVTFDVEGPEYQGRKIFENWNVQNQSKQAVDIGLRAIKQCAKSAGIPANGDITAAFIESLEGCVVDAQVKIETDKSGQYGPQNRVSRYYPLETTNNTQPQPQQYQQPNQQAWAGSIQPQRTAPNIQDDGNYQRTPEQQAIVENYRGTGHPQDISTHQQGGESNQDWQNRANQGGQPWNR